MRYFLLFIFYFCFLFGYSQTSLDSAIPDLTQGDELITTPDVLAFQTINSLPIDLYTGRVNITLPLYEIKSGDISVPISISYNSGGIKVDDVASNVGMGWNLNASGSIVSITKDIDDHELDVGVWSEQDWDYGIINYYYASIKGYFREYDEIFDIRPSGTSLDQGYKDRAKEDASPDLFVANAPGLSTKFILEKDNGSYYALPIDASGVKSYEHISYSYDGATGSFGFTFGELGFTNGFFGNPPSENWIDGRSAHCYLDFKLQTPNGVKYTFNKRDIVETIPRRTEYNPFSALEILHKSHKVRASAWHLSEIEDPKYGTTVSFDYEEYSKPTVQYIKKVMDKSLVSNADPKNYNSIPVFGHFPFFNKYYNPQNNNLDDFLYKSGLSFMKYPRVNRIKTITFDNNKVEFFYDQNRLDSYDEKALTEIRVSDFKGQLVKKFVFEYSYDISKEGCNEPACKRLRLEKVKQISTLGKSIDLYTFDYDGQKLPKVNSLQQDYLGYYNNNGIATPPITSFNPKKPILYYHKNKGKYSILPFPLSNESPQTIPGDFSLLTNDYSLAGLLKSITYSTGGKTEFEYEKNSFNLLNAEYFAGGARIKKQKLNDANGNEKVIEYLYQELTGNTSGYINNIPVFGFPLAWDPNKTNNNVSFTVYDKNRTGIELTNNSYVGYSRVIEKEIGKGYIENVFSAPNTFPNEEETFEYYEGGNNYIPQNTRDLAVTFLKNNSAYPSSNYIDNDIVRGKLANKKMFTEENILIKEQIFNYNRNIFSIIDLNYRDPLSSYKGMDGNFPPLDWFFYHSSHLNIERDLLINEINKDYLDGVIKTTSTSYIYKPNLPYIKQKKFQDDLDIFTIDNFYPGDTELNNEPFMFDLIVNNRFSEVVKETKRKNNKVISQKLMKYGGFNIGGVSSVPLPESISNAKGDFDLEDDNIEITRRIQNGNIREYRNVVSGIYYTTIWGYNDQYPIAKIEDIQYNDIDVAQIIAIKDASNTGAQEALLIALNNFRNSLNGKKITTYTFKPLVGLLTKTNINGNTYFYEYDDFGRLQYVIDDDEKVISENQYKYYND